MVDAREREGVLRTGFVEVGELDTHALLPALLGDDEWVREPVRVLHFSNDASIQQLAGDVGWNPRWPIFHERSAHDEHERITQTNKIRSHMC